MCGWVSRCAGTRTWTLALVVCLTVGYSGWIVHVVRTDRTVDFYAYYLASESIARGSNPYEVSTSQRDALARELGLTHWQTPYRYPPHTAVMLLALRPLGPRGAAMLWGFINGAALIAGAYLLGGIGSRRWGHVATMTMLLFWYPAWDSLRSGQISGIMFLLLVLALLAYLKGREGWAGSSLALATVLKVFPVLLVLYVAWRRRWTSTLASLAVIAASFLLCVPFAGVATVSSYPAHAIALSEPGLVSTASYNQTLTATLGRLVDGSVSTGTILIVSRVLGVVVLIVTFALCWPRRKFARWVSLEFALVVPVCLLLPTFTFPHWLVILLVPSWIAFLSIVAARRCLVLGGLGFLFLAASGQETIYWHSAGLWNSLTGNEAWRLLSLPFLFTLALWLVIARYVSFKFAPSDTPEVPSEATSEEIFSLRTPGGAQKQHVG